MTNKVEKFKSTNYMKNIKGAIVGLIFCLIIIPDNNSVNIVINHKYIAVIRHFFEESSSRRN